MLLSLDFIVTDNMQNYKEDRETKGCILVFS